MKDHQTGYRLVFIHGAGQDSTCWNFQTDFFKDAEAVSLPQHRPNEYSDNDSRYSIDMYASWLHDWLRSEKRLDRVREKMVLVGHSMGGAIALSFARTFPKSLHGLILVSTGARLRVNETILETLERNYEAGVDYIIASSFTAEVPAEIKRQARETMLQIEPRVTINDFQACNEFDLRNELGLIADMPTLVTCGTADVMAPVRLSNFLAENIPGARLELIDAGGHMLMLEKPDQLNRLIDGFVSDLPELA